MCVKYLNPNTPYRHANFDIQVWSAQRLESQLNCTHLVLVFHQQLLQLMYRILHTLILSSLRICSPPPTRKLGWIGYLCLRVELLKDILRCSERCDIDGLEYVGCVDEDCTMEDTSKYSCTWWKEEHS